MVVASRQMMFKSTESMSQHIPFNGIFKEFRLTTDCPCFLKFDFCSDVRRNYKLVVSFDHKAYQEQEVHELRPITLKFTELSYRPEDHIEIKVHIAHKEWSGLATARLRLPQFGLLGQCPKCRKNNWDEGSKLVLKDLPCGHVMCTVCLDLAKENGEVRCVMDNILVTTPIDDLLTDDFPVDQREKNELKKFHESAAGQFLRTQFKIRCSQDVGHPGTHFCNKCEKIFCNSCGNLDNCEDETEKHDLALKYEKCCAGLKEKPDCCVDPRCTIEPADAAICCKKLAEIHHEDHIIFTDEQMVTNDDLWGKLNDAKRELQDREEHLKECRRQIEEGSEERHVVEEIIGKLSEDDQVVARKKFEWITSQLSEQHQAEEKTVTELKEDISAHLAMVTKGSPRYFIVGDRKTVYDLLKRMPHGGYLHKLADLSWEENLTNPKWYPLYRRAPIRDATHQAFEVIDLEVETL